MGKYMGLFLGITLRASQCFFETITTFKSLCTAVIVMTKISRLKPLLEIKKVHG